MHIEPGFVAPAKLAAANAAALGVLGYYLKDLVIKPLNMVKAGLAALFFSVFMQGFHMNVGPSELHFIGAMPIYLALGFVPTVFGFFAGLLLQGLIFEPMDLQHLAVNSLSLIVPLVTVHLTMGKALFSGSIRKRVDLKTILKLDGAFYGGVTLMVGFWLFTGEVATPFSSWLAFAGSYLAIVAVEPVFTLVAVRALKRYEHKPIVERLFAVKGLKVGA